MDQFRGISLENHLVVIQGNYISLVINVNDDQNFDKIGFNFEDPDNPRIIINSMIGGNWPVKREPRFDEIAILYNEIKTLPQLKEVTVILKQIYMEKLRWARIQIDQALIELKEES